MEYAEIIKKVNALAPNWRAGALPDLEVLIDLNACESALEWADVLKIDELDLKHTLAIESAYIPNGWVMDIRLKNG
jgi:hypothetical protein